MAFNTAFDLESMVVNTKAAAVYAAQEASLFMGGAIIPMVQMPAGSITTQIPLMGSVTAEKLTAAAPATVDDFTALTLTDTSKTITANIYAARHVLRDMGSIDPQETGRVLGNAVTASFDADCVGTFTGFGSEVTGSLDMADLFNAVASIRDNGETGQLYGIISPTAAAQLMTNIGGAAFAGGDFQSEAMRTGFVGNIAGINIFQSAHVTDANVEANIVGGIFGADALRIAMSSNLDLEIARRAAAVGWDCVASMGAGVGLVDANRGVKLLSA